ncbi:hypothetical protein A3C09_04255 [Candidatus Uhrbacteria bacterium RIFCSPHIGHO2_02_FULL_47_44]|uniref:EfeO-type cupredoxin-like domain-containing protein n=1 Tax=Candidatus Uhrbacteria bacterium RIFCSPLOWO2_02_FULL_48_18 TaxID=1802408 RepID=A0A1F7V9D3_9BACT|nr:MAG: hypothetical protein A2839_02600 [Candidatus Uhrbacteria bacterium RIFCSPHIGHO2_01_FULL_47_10]OGL70755.1 MAG: hypothetical protein A3C09_04255 [Candidatus Uhrbacteria bacterium RIFCSPHIGHO2_02_FULL_47_44]OGL77138.1 MAG: hypothetical protein A3E97_03290 [Candidatus Uhrbacteria bacterium RIFCSPHIGHO2_12_FULL_47_12]OGL82218.1 MAG: hypothetical protein A3B20_00480 [Candidatus Uhrbacteria bacterium RIFCSPLOWO2_01_FULL_47_17]OGL86708.1 MAG: hypothetical protein A3I41_05245 [Candidatus Uhrbact
MKKIIFALSIFVFIGAGCAKTPVQTNEDTVQTSAPEVSFTTINSDGTTSEQSIVVGKDGKEVKNIERDDEGTPIIDVKLNAGNSVRTIDLKSGNFFFEPKIIKAKPGEKLRVDFRGNVGTHTFVIDEAKVNVPVKDGSGFEFVVPTTPGSYPFYCDIGNHRAMGMVGTLVVE